MAMKNPPHPGDFVRTEIIKPAGLTVTAAAAALQVSRPALSSLLNGKADLSGIMALRIEKAFGVKMDTLMRMQAPYDIAQTRRREKQIRVKRLEFAYACHSCRNAIIGSTLLARRAGTKLAISAATTNTQIIAANVTASI